MFHGFNLCRTAFLSRSARTLLRMAGVSTSPSRCPVCFPAELYSPDGHLALLLFMVNCKRDLPRSAPLVAPAYFDELLAWFRGWVQTIESPGH
jgi:hypothetical protein